MSPQFSIAHYRITAKLGEGGMGEVWRATDTKLGRDVAIKILPEAFAQDTDRMARFEREAQVLASLNHPNIAAIYGVAERALIMELVEGETLHGPFPAKTALNYARQIAQAAGKPVDKRADIWSYGVGLWEMLTGKRLFESGTISHTLADELRAPIDLDQLPKETPTAIRTFMGETNTITRYWRYGNSFVSKIVSFCKVVVLHS